MFARVDSRYLPGTRLALWLNIAQPGQTPRSRALWPRRLPVSRTDCWPTTPGAMDKRTRKPWLLFLLFGLFLLRTPQLVGDSPPPTRLAAVTR